MSDAEKIAHIERICSEVKNGETYLEESVIDEILDVLGGR